jgi:[CysO sulfur-carrier protein]-S-L-cysteine hydrolase
MLARDSLDGIEIPGSALKEMIRHCLSESPAEAVGLLAGQGAAVRLVEPLRNIVSKPHNRLAFLADPYCQFLAERRTASTGLELLAIYHSHPDGGASLSAKDIAVSRRDIPMHVVISFPVQLPKQVVTRAYRLINGRPREVAIVVVGPYSLSLGSPRIM